MSPRWRVAKRVWVVFSILWTLGILGLFYVVAIERDFAQLSWDNKGLSLLLTLVAPQGALIVAWFSWRVARFSWRFLVLPLTRWIVAPLDDDKRP